MTGSDIENINIEDKNGDEESKPKAFGMQVSDVLLDTIEGEDNADGGGPNVIYTNMIDDHPLLGIWCGDHTTFTRTERLVYFSAFICVALLVNAFGEEIEEALLEACASQNDCSKESFEDLRAISFVYDEGGPNEQFVDIGASILGAIVSTVVDIFALLPFVKKLFQMESQRFNKIVFFAEFVLTIATGHSFFHTIFGNNDEVRIPICFIVRVCIIRPTSMMLGTYILFVHSSNTCLLVRFSMKCIINY